MEKETYSKQVGDAQYTLVVEYEKRLSQEELMAQAGGESSVEPTGLALMEWPDKVTLAIRTAGKEQQMTLTGLEYKELRDLMSKDVDSGRYIGAIRPVRRHI